MNKELERELNWLYDLAYNVVNPANKEDTDNAYKTIKESLERLEKLEKVVEILKDTVDFNVFCREAKKGDGIEKTYFIIFGEIWIKIAKEQYELLKEVFGE